MFIDKLTRFGVESAVPKILPIPILRTVTTNAIPTSPPAQNRCSKNFLFPLRIQRSSLCVAVEILGEILCILEFPLLIQLAGTRFRFGIEVGNFGFENYLPVGGKISGITAMGLFSFPAGPGKVMFGTGLVGNRFGYSAAMSYGFSMGNTLEIRAGVRSTTAWDVMDDKDNVLGTVSWFDGLIMFGFNL